MANHKRDVEIVQGLLNRHIVPPVGLPKVDGYAGPATINAILAFQRRIGIVNCDGRVDPGAGPNDPMTLAVTTAVMAINRFTHHTAWEDFSIPQQ